MTIMEKSKIALQQNAVLSLLSTIVTDFGAVNINVKLLLSYVMGANV